MSGRQPHDLVFGHYEAGQFATRDFVFSVGWTFDFIPVVWLLRSVQRRAGHAATPAQGLHATTPRVSAMCGAVHRSSGDRELTPKV